MLNTSYCFIDVELANNKRSSICALGIICVSDGSVIMNKYYLIDPECEFSDSCIQIHGIMPLMVAGAPTFPQVWSEISAYIENGVIVAHNAASMECNAICQTLDRYHLPVPRLRYVCTMCNARRLIPDQKYGLHDLCDYFGIQLDHHHDAMCDARACMDLFNALSDRFGAGAVRAEWYDYAPANSSRTRYTGSTSQRESCGFQRGAAEARETGFGALSCASALKARCASVPNFVFCSFGDFRAAGRKFCLTGDFALRSRDAVKKSIVEKGGSVTTGVSGTTGYLIVGANGSEQWKFGNFGDKIEKARALNADGAQITIMSELDFIAAIDAAAVPDAADPANSSRTRETAFGALDTSDYKGFFDALMSLYPDLKDMFPEFRILKSGASLYFYRQRAAVLGFRKASGVYVELTATDVDAEELARIPHTVHPSKGAAQSYKVPYDPANDNASLFALIHSIARDCFYSANVEHFGCCNSFRECSAAMRCVHLDDWEYVGCEYRKNLEKGLCFYGGNN